MDLSLFSSDMAASARNIKLNPEAIQMVLYFADGSLAVAENRGDGESLTTHGSNNIGETGFDSSSSPLSSVHICGFKSDS